MSITNSLRYKILKRDKFTCRYCGSHGVELEVDHVNPRANGGSDDEENLVTACLKCNRGKLDDDAPILQSEEELYVMSSDGYAGKVIVERESFWRVELFDAIAFVGYGGLQLSGQLRDIPKDQAIVFNDVEAYVQYALLKTRQHVQSVNGSSW